MPIHVINEAKRCLNCKKPLCRQGCPINTAIPQMIELFLNGDMQKAGEMLFENNPLSLVCSLICNHDKQCEGNCVLNKKSSPVHISSIENYISDSYFDRMTVEKAEPNGMKVAIIGSGPAGITIAVNLAKKGYDVTIFESKDDLFDDGYKAIFIGTGVWRPNSLKIKGQTLGHVHFAINYLANPDVYDLGKEVIIIGAGNAAMDVARTVIRKGSKNVTVYARTPGAAASPREVEYAIIDGVRFEYNIAPVEITEEGVVFKNVKVDDHESIIWEDENTFLKEADSVIIAVSQGPRDRIISTTSGIKANDKGLVVTNNCGETTRGGIFASGDVVLGAKTVVEAVAYSKAVADEMDKYMQGLSN